jgi:hypothetical protein
MPTRIRNDAPFGACHSRIDLLDRRDQIMAGTDRAFGVVLMGLGIAEVGEDAVAQILGYVAAIAFDRGLGRILIGASDLAQVLRIETPRQLGRAYHIGEHDGQLASLGDTPFDHMAGAMVYLDCLRPGDRCQDPFAMAQG